jgi:hypothetical protein
MMDGCVIPERRFTLEGGGAVQQSLLDSLPGRNRIAAGQNLRANGAGRCFVSTNGSLPNVVQDRASIRWFPSQGSPAKTSTTAMTLSCRGSLPP